MKCTCYYDMHIILQLLCTFIYMIYDLMLLFDKYMAIIGEINLWNALTVTVATGTRFHWDPKNYWDLRYCELLNRVK